MLLTTKNGGWIVLFVNKPMWDPYGWVPSPCTKWVLIKVWNFLWKKHLWQRLPHKRKTIWVFSLFIYFKSILIPCMILLIDLLIILFKNCIKELSTITVEVGWNRGAVKYFGELEGGGQHFWRFMGGAAKTFWVFLLQICMSIL